MLCTGHAYREFSSLITDGGKGKLTVVGTIAGLVLLGSIRNQADQAIGNRPVSTTTPWPLHQLMAPGS